MLTKFEEWLPHWLGKEELQWIQWAYAMWQIVRSNALALLVLSYLSFYIDRWRKEKGVVVLGASKDYDMSAEMMISYYSGGGTVNNLDEVSLVTRNLEILSTKDKWTTVKHRGYYYLTHENNLRQLAACLQLFDGNVIFVDNLLAVTGSLAVGRKLSQTEAYERIFSKRYLCGKGADYLVVPTFFNYADLNSKFWGVLSTIPILLQARNYNKFSNILSLTTIVLDLNRRRLYNIYDHLFHRFAKFVKLHIFKERTVLYNFFSIFSSRWIYSDTVKKYAYVARAHEEVTVRSYCKLKSLEDLKAIDSWTWGQYHNDPNDQHICMEIVEDRAYCKLLQRDELYATVTLNRPVYVS